MKIRLKSVDSTQSYLKEKVLEGGVFQHLDCVMSGVQTAGLGRQGRPWIAEAGNLHASLYLHPGHLPLTWIPLWIGVSVAKVMLEYGVTREQVRIKWPNDVVDAGSGAKIAGILCEKVQRIVIAGIGVNLRAAPPVEGRVTTSVADLTGMALPLDFPEEFLDRLLGELKFEPYLRVLKKTYEEWAWFRPGDVIRFEDAITREEGHGRVTGYGEYGEMIVMTANGERRLLSEEVHLKSRS
jgi:BirA family biotin operon repressor/biotin-[acetyl-CoA-carboxylase] ligase